MVETALVAAIFALVPEWALFMLLVPPLHEGFHGAWGWCLRLAVAVPPFLTPVAAGVAGVILARQARPSRPVLRWLLIGLGAKAAAPLCGALLLFLPGPHGPIRWTLFCLAALVLAVAAAAYPVPMMWAVIAHAIVSRRRARIVTRVVLALLVIGAIAVWAIFAATSLVKGAQSVEALSVSPSGRIYAATRGGVFAAGPKSTTLRYLRCGSVGRAASMVEADARDDRLVWTGLQVPDSLVTNLLESRDAGRTWHAVAALPPHGCVLSTRSAIYAYDPDPRTLWVNRSGAAGGWQKRPLRLPRIKASGRVRVFRKVIAASSQHPGLVMLAAECEVSAVSAGGATSLARCRGPDRDSGARLMECGSLLPL